MLPIIISAITLGFNLGMAISALIKGMSKQEAKWYKIANIGCLLLLLLQNFSVGTDFLFYKEEENE